MRLMPSGYDPILTNFTSITTSSSDCSGEGTKRTYQGLWRLPGTTSARARWSTLAYVEKVRPQFLSLRQIGRRCVFSERSRRQLSPLTAAISNLGSALQMDRTALLFSEKPVSL